ncbi:14023_t:CDS:1, partial [Funneliformis caledonium]
QGEIYEDNLIDKIAKISLTNKESSNIEDKDVIDYNIDNLVNKYGLDS